VNADAVRAQNRQLDEAILSLVDTLDAGRLHEHEPATGADGADGAEETWSAAIVLGHLGEFPHFFAAELRRCLADPTGPVGRTHTHPERLAAVAASAGRSGEELRAAVAAAFADLADALDGLADHHVTMTTNNRKYGEEPLSEFLDRYVLGHKRGHLAQLASMPAARPTLVTEQERS
jgi:DinB superfamily